MARTFGKLLCTIWDDPDFLALSSNAKVLYSAFISQHDITPAGVLALTERRWKRFLGGDLNAVAEALDELRECRFVLVDEDTAEVLVRSFIVHDGRLDNANLAKSVHSSVVDIRSECLREACRRTLADFPEKPPGRTPLEGPSDAVPNGVGTPMARDPELLEPRPRANTLSQQPRAASREPSGNTFLDDVIDCMIGDRLRQERNIRHPARYRQALQRDLPLEHGARIDELHAKFPTAAASSIAAACISGDTRPLAGHEAP